MKQFIHIWLSRFFRFTFIGLITVICYTVFIKSLVYGFHKWRVEQHLIKDFHKNREQLDDLVKFLKQLNTLQDFKIEGKDSISFSVYDTLIDKTDKNAYIDSGHFGLGIYPLSVVHSVQIKDNNFIVDFSYNMFPDSSEAVYKRDTLIHKENWIVDFDGNMDDPIAKTLLDYNKISLNQVEVLVKKLEILKLKGIDNTEDYITLTYAKYVAEEFYYYIPLKDIDTSHIKRHKLADNYYWSFHKHPLIDILIDWSQYYPLKQD